MHSEIRSIEEATVVVTLEMLVSVAFFTVALPKTGTENLQLMTFRV
jgi:hypothetical protein